MENLKNNWVDYGVALAKGAAGSFPYGGLAGELLGAVIPNQRMDRISRFLEEVALRVRHLERERLQAKVAHPETIELLEDGIVQAARAVSDDRLRYLSALLAGNIGHESSSYQETKRLLALMSELTDVEIIILASYDSARHPQRDPEFWERHKAVLTPRFATYSSTPQEIDAATIYSSYRQHLVQVQLLKPTFRSIRRGEVPEFDDKTGMIKSSGYSVTALGSLLLKRIDMAGKP